MICNIQDPITREDYSRDPRNVARKSVNYLKSTGIADTAYIGPEAEFFIFDDVRFDQKPNQGFYYIDSIEGEWNRGKDYKAAGEGPNLGYKLRHKEGYFPVPPADQMMDIRNEMMQTMIECGLDVEAQHHEVATAGQSEIDLRFNELVKMADAMLTVQVHHQERRHETRQDGDVHAQAGVRRQRQRHAHAHFAVEGRRAVVCRQRLCRTERNGAARHRRHPEARTGDPGVQQSDHQQLQATGARATKLR